MSGDKIKITVYVFAGFFGLLLFNNNSFALENNCDDALKVLNKGQVLEAQKIIYNLKGKPNAACLDIMANTAIIGGDFDNAASALKELIKRNPANLSAVSRLARLYSWQGNYTPSLHYYSLALAMKPSDCKLSIEKARVLAWAAMSGESSAFYSVAEKNCEAGGIAEEAAGKNNLRRGRIYSAEKYLKKSIELNPKNAESLFDLAQLYSNSKVYDEAEKYYKLLAEISPYNTAAVNARNKNSAQRYNMRLFGGFSL